MKLLQNKKYAKDVVLVGLLALTICVAGGGCSKKKKKDNTTTSGVTPTVYVLATVSSSGILYGVNWFDASVSIMDSGNIVKDATVTVNGSVLPYYALSQGYKIPSGSSLVNTLGTTPGSTVTISITSSVGNFTVSGVMPAEGSSISIPIPGCMDLSELILTAS